MRTLTISVTDPKAEALLRERLMGLEGIVLHAPEAWDDLPLELQERLTAAHESRLAGRSISLEEAEAELERALQ